MSGKKRQPAPSREPPDEAPPAPEKASGAPEPENCRGVPTYIGGLSTIQVEEARPQPTRAPFPPRNRHLWGSAGEIRTSLGPTTPLGRATSYIAWVDPEGRRGPGREPRPVAGFHRPQKVEVPGAPRGRPCGPTGWPAGPFSSSEGMVVVLPPARPSTLRAKGARSSSSSCPRLTSTREWLGLSPPAGRPPSSCRHARCRGLLRKRNAGGGARARGARSTVGLVASTGYRGCRDFSSAQAPSRGVGFGFSGISPTWPGPACLAGSRFAAGPPQKFARGSPPPPRAQSGKADCRTGHLPFVTQRFVGARGGGGGRTWPPFESMGMGPVSPADPPVFCPRPSRSLPPGKSGHSTADERVPTIVACAPCCASRPEQRLLRGIRGKIVCGVRPRWAGPRVAEIRRGLRCTNGFPPGLPARLAVLAYREPKPPHPVPPHSKKKSLTARPPAQTASGLPPRRAPLVDEGPSAVGTGAAPETRASRLVAGTGFPAVPHAHPVSGPRKDGTPPVGRQGP